MTTETTSIDDLLAEASNPKVSELQSQEIENDNIVDDDIGDSQENNSNNEYKEVDSDDDNHEDKPERNYDDYGNEKSAPKTYTEDEVNERINKAVRDRLSRGNPANQQLTQQQVQQQSQGFEYNPDSEQRWQ